MNYRLCFHDQTGITKAVIAQSGPCYSYWLTSCLCTEHLWNSSECTLPWGVCPWHEVTWHVLIGCFLSVLKLFVKPPYVDVTLPRTREIPPSLITSATNSVWGITAFCAYLLMVALKHCVLSSKQFSDFKLKLFPNGFLLFSHLVKFIRASD